jgi:pilus assembly protein CpaB
MSLPKGAIALCIAGLLLAVAAHLLGGVIVENKRKSVRRGWTLSPVVVATTDVPAGALLARDQLEVREVPEQWGTPSLAADPQGLVGKRTSVALGKGAPILAGALSELKACP